MKTTKNELIILEGGYAKKTKGRRTHIRLGSKGAKKSKKKTLRTIERREIIDHITFTDVTFLENSLIKMTHLSFSFFHERFFLRKVRGKADGNRRCPCHSKSKK